MELAQKKDTDYMANKEWVRWGSHIPVNSSILKVFDITGVMELGIGYHSTPMFFESAKKVIAIETDKAWIDKLSTEIKQDDDHKIVYHETPKHIKRATRRHQLSDNELLDARNFMLSHITDELNFLFIDCISSFRWEALTYLHDKFDVITFHDYQHPGIRNHYCNGKLELSEDYEMFIDKTYMSHTGILIHKKLVHKFDELIRVHAEEVPKFYDSEPTLVRF